MKAAPRCRHRWRREGAGGTRLTLVRVEIGDTTDVGRLTPLLGGGHRYDPLPALLSSRRRALALIYHDGEGMVALSMAEARGLKDVAAS